MKSIFNENFVEKKKFMSLVNSAQDPNFDTNTRHVCYPNAHLITQWEQAFCLLLFSTFQSVMDGICSIGREMLVQ